MRIIKRFASCAAVIACTAFSSGAIAQAPQGYPAGPVSIIVPFVPGGATDALGRLLAQALNERWKTPVVVENKPGASGVIGTDYVAKAQPDGLTLLLGTQTALAVTPSLKSLSYNVKTDFTPISLLVTTPLLLLASDKIEAKSASALINDLKSNPEKYSYGTSGVGTSQHLTTLLFLDAIGAKALHVPYKGTGQFLVDLAGGQIDMAFDNLGTALGASKQDAIQALAITGSTRSPLAPEIPTLAESGIPNFEAVTWLGLLAPAGLSKPVVDYLNSEVVAVLNDPKFKEKLSAQGMTPRPMSSSQFREFIDAENIRFANVIKKNNVVVE
ncbi:Bug family tripartite tricarboxylate transporter substrate binding protein [Allopusillimonas soli]|nr:tripartite tricarboxylate transporter substrate binding protein [Allopusillimonas soli]